MLEPRVAFELSDILASLLRLAEKAGQVVYGPWVYEPDGQVRSRQITVTVGEFTASFWRAEGTAQ